MSYKDERLEGKEGEKKGRKQRMMEKKAREIMNTDHETKIKSSGEDIKKALKKTERQNEERRAERTSDRRTEGNKNNQRKKHRRGK